MVGFTLLWSKILDSSLWVTGSKELRLVWITILAMKDSNGVVQASVVGLADRAKVSVVECRTALDTLKAPDPEDTSKVEEGRRIRDIPGGWQVINHDLYRFSTEAKREFWRKAKADQRAKSAPRRAKKASKGVKIPADFEDMSEHEKEIFGEDPVVKKEARGVPDSREWTHANEA
jgi:hypothetical protein